MGAAEALIELEGPASARPRRWPQAVLVVASTTLLLASVLALVVGGEPAPLTPARRLARLQAFAQRARSAHFTGDARTVSSTGSAAAGSESSSHEQIVGAMELPDRSQWTVDSGDMAFEALITPSGTYDRQADSLTALSNEQWAYTARRAKAGSDQLGSLPSGHGMASAMGMATAVDAPELLDILRATRAPVQVDERTIRAEVDATKIPHWDTTGPGAPLQPLPTITVELTSAVKDKDRLDRMVLTAKEDVDEALLDPSSTGPSGHRTTITSTLDVRFTRWGERVNFAIPTPDAVDLTPGVAEADVAAFAATPLLGLRRLPAGYELMHAEVTTAEKDADPSNGDCAEVGLSYANPADLAAMTDKATASVPPSIDVSLTPAACDYYDTLTGGTAVSLGRARGMLVRGKGPDEYAVQLQILVGATRVRIDSDLPEAQVLAAASDLVRLDLGSQPVHHEPPPPTAA
jgi:hypothetical protein